MNTNKAKLLVYDEKNRFSQELIEDWISRGYQVQVASPEQIASLLAQETPDLVVMNLKGAPDDPLSELVREIKVIDDNVPILCLTPQASVEGAVRMMKEGVYDFIQLPVDREVLSHVMERALRLYQLTQKVFFLERQKGWKGNSAASWGPMPPCRRISRPSPTWRNRRRPFSSWASRVRARSWWPRRSTACRTVQRISSSI
ncbi:MAG: response regulator [bacterium]